MALFIAPSLLLADIMVEFCSAGTSERQGLAYNLCFRGVLMIEHSSFCKVYQLIGDDRSMWGLLAVGTMPRMIKVTVPYFCAVLR